MTQKKRNILIVLAVAVLALLTSALLFACKGGSKDDGGGGAAETGVITLVDDSGSYNSQYTLEVGADVYSFMQSRVPEKAHAEFAYWEYEGEELKQGLKMTEAITLTAVYKIEVTLQIYARNISGYENYQDDGDYTYMDALDVVFYDFAGTSYTASKLEDIVDDTLGSIAITPESGNSGLTVNSDYTKNTVKLNYSRDQITVRFSTNYPADGGKSDVTTDRVTYYGYPVTLSSNYTCDGYLMLGWSSQRYDSFPEYAVDSISERLLVWNGATYEVVGSSGEEVVFYPERTTAMYVIWAKGYIDMFGGGDTVFVVDEDAEYVYLLRGGYFYKSEKGIGGEYSFTNYSDITGSFSIKLSTDYVFTFWEERLMGPWYRYTLTFDASTESLTAATSETDYIDFSEYDDVVYVSGGNRSEGKYRLDDTDGVYALSFTSGPLTGETRKVALDYDTDGKKVFMFQSEDEAAMGRLSIGVTSYDEDYGTYATCYLDDYYYLQLNGFGTCLYYLYGTSYTYRYWLDGSENVLYLYYSTYGTSSGEYIYVLAGKFKEVLTDVVDSTTGEEIYAWFLYYEEYDGTFDVYSADGTEKIGTVTLDGYSNAVYESVDGQRSYGRYSFSSIVEGTAIYLGGTGAETGVDCSRFLQTTDSNGKTIYKLVLSSYKMLYHYSASGLNYDILTLDYDGVGSAKYSVLGYDWYDNAYYFTVMTGTYAEYYNADYGFTYYVFTVDDNSYDWTEYFKNYIYIYYSSLKIDVYSEITELAFVVGALGSYPADMWLWYSTTAREPADAGDTGNTGETEQADEDPWARDGDVVYIEEYKNANFAFTFDWETYGEDNGGDGSYIVTNEGTAEFEATVDFVIIDGGVVFGSVTYTSGEEPNAETKTWYVEGTVYGTLQVLDESQGAEPGDTFTATLIIFEFAVYTEAVEGTETAEPVAASATYYYSYIYIRTDLEEGMQQVTDIPTYEYLLTLDGDEIDKSESVYIKHNGLDSGDEIDFTYFDGTTAHEGKVTLNDNLGGNDYGYVVYTFTASDDSGITFNFVYMYYTSGSESERVYMIYDEDKIISAKGSDGSTVTVDPLGFEAIYTDKNGNEYVATYLDFEVGYAEDGETISYIQLRVGTTLITLDFVADGTTGYDYTVRGWEMGEYYIVDYLQRQYIVFLDGEGGATVYSLDGTSVGSGTYTMTDTVIAMTYTVNGEEHNSVTAVVDVEAVYAVVYEDGTNGYMYLSFGSIYVDNEEFTGTYINSDDMSTMTLRTNGTATLERTGETLEGTYTWLDDTYFHFTSDDESFSSMFMKGENNNISSPNYNAEAKYYTADMGKFFELTTGGELKADGETYYYTVSPSTSTVIIYYVPTDPTAEVNKFGYATYEGFGQIGQTYTAKDTTTTYYNISYLGAAALTRATNNTGYNYRYGSTRYQIGNLTISASGAGSDSVSAILGYGADGTGSTLSVTVTIDTEKTTQNGKPVMTVWATTYHAMYVYGWYGYLDFLYYEYDIEVDLSAGTYSITDERFYLITYYDDYLMSSYYGYSLAAYSYAYMILCWDIDSNGVATSQTASGYILPNMFGEYMNVEEEGDGGGTVTASTWVPTVPEFEDVSFTMQTENGTTYFYISLPGAAEGVTYELKFYLSFKNIWNAAYGYNSFYIDKLWTPETFEVTVDGSTYKVKIGYGLYSDSYATTRPFVEIISCEGTEGAGDYAETVLNILTVMEMDGAVYAMEGYRDDNGTVRSRYWKITCTEASGGAAGALSMSVASEIKSYETAGNGFIDLYTNSTGGTGILVVYMASGSSYYFYLVYSCEYDETSGTYTVLLADGYYYTVTLTEGTDDEGNTTYTGTVALA